MWATELLTQTRLQNRTGTILLAPNQYRVSSSSGTEDCKTPSLARRSLALVRLMMLACWRCGHRTAGSQTDWTIYHGCDYSLCRSLSLFLDATFWFLPSCFCSFYGIIYCFPVSLSMIMSPSSHCPSSLVFSVESKSNSNKCMVIHRRITGGYCNSVPNSAGGWCENQDWHPRFL
jgi:hypothetical protein